MDSGAIQTITSDRYNSGNPIWSTDGKWLYFLSDRNLKTTIPSPWGPRQPAPHFDRTVKIYELALTAGLRSPFLPPDELHPDTSEKKDEEKPADDKDKGAKPVAADTKAADNKAADADKTAEKKDDKGAEKKDEAKDKKKPVEVKIDFTDLGTRLDEVPVPPATTILCKQPTSGCAGSTPVTTRSAPARCNAWTLPTRATKSDTVLAKVKGYEISLDRKKLLVARDDDFFVLDSDVKGTALNDPKVLPKAKIDLSHWTFSTNPREEYRGIFLDAWRLERDYFYDRNMQGVDWAAMRDRYLPLVDRVANRDELNAVIAQMVSELSALHTFVMGGDARRPSDQVEIADAGRGSSPR